MDDERKDLHMKLATYRGQGVGESSNQEPNYALEKLRTENILTDGEHYFQPKAIATYLFPKEASKTIRTLFVEVVVKQANEHNNK